MRLGPNFRWRLIGVIALSAAGGTSLLHRAVLSAYGHGPATLAEFALGLTSFCLASYGILLLLHGAALHGRAAKKHIADHVVATQRSTPNVVVDLFALPGCRATPIPRPDGQPKVAQNRD